MYAISLFIRFCACLNGRADGHDNDRPEIILGKPVIKDIHITVHLNAKQLANGTTEAELLRDYSDMKKEDIKARCCMSGTFRP